MDRKKKVRELSALADSEEDLRLIEKIEQQRRAIMHARRHGGKLTAAEAELRDLHLDGYRFRLNMRTAPAAIDTLIDLWIDNAHMRLPGFDGQANRTVIDIGANEGFYSLRIKRQNPSARVLAVEPVQATYARLTDNIALNSCHKVYPLRAAACNADGPLSLQRHTTVPTVSSLDVSALEQGWIKPESLREEAVPGCRLDSIMRDYRRYGFDKIDVLKIDVEGAELAVLQGARETLAKTARIVLEWHAPLTKRGAITFLVRQGFRLLREESRRFGDLYFERKR